jgi:dihydrofolate reductase
MRLTIQAFVTLDGVMQAPGGADEDRSNGFEAGGWLVPFADEDFGQIVDGWFRSIDAVLLGRTTFDMMRTFWTQITDPDDRVAAVLNRGRKYLVSGSITDPGWGDTVVLSGDPVEEVRALKEQPGGELQVHGSARLARTLHEAGLVDEYRILTFPVTVGQGKRLFGEAAAPQRYRMVDSRITASGAVYTAFTPEPFTIGEISIEDGREVINS